MTEAAAETLLVPGTAPSERRWGKLLLALLAFLTAPYILWFRAFLPIENTASITTLPTIQRTSPPPISIDPKSWPMNTPRLA